MSSRGTIKKQVIGGIIAVVVTVGAGLLLHFMTRDKEDPSRALWEQNWLTITEPLPHLGSGGRSFTNRDRLLDILRALNFSETPDLERERSKLVELVEGAPAHEEPLYNMVYTEEIALEIRKLKREVRAEAIKHGVTITDRH